MKQELTGLIAAPYTPMDSAGKINLAIIPRLADSLLENGVKGAFICGTTGESMSLTLKERMQIAESWQKAADPALPVIAHVGHLALEDAQTLAAHAQATGLHSIAALAPFFFQAPTLEELVAFFAEIASAAPSLPFYYYHIPSMTHVTFTGIDFLKAASGKIPTLAGIKFTHVDLMDMSECQAFEGGRYNILFGRDEMLLSGLATGIKGAVGSNYNFAAPVFNKIIAAFEAGDMETAREYQRQGRRIIIPQFTWGGQGAGKSIMKMIGLDCGPVRLPLRNISTAQYNGLRQELEAAGLFASLQPNLTTIN